MEAKPIDLTKTLNEYKKDEIRILIDRFVVKNDDLVKRSSDAIDG